MLEPLSGYLWLGASLAAKDGADYVGAFNFGPPVESNRPVGELVDLVVDAWGAGEWNRIERQVERSEAATLSLSWEKAYHRLGWRPVWSLERAVAETVAWYRAWEAGSSDLGKLSHTQISRYQGDARSRGLIWALDR